MNGHFPNYWVRYRMAKRKHAAVKTGRRLMSDPKITTAPGMSLSTREMSRLGG